MYEGTVEKSWAKCVGRKANELIDSELNFKKTKNCKMYNNFSLPLSITYTFPKGAQKYAVKSRNTLLPAFRQLYK